jgi:hypothetical protein
MKLLLPIAFSLLISCHKEVKHIAPVTKKVKTQQIQDTLKTVCDSATINGNLFIACYIIEGNTSIVNEAKDTIYKNSNPVGSIEFVDIDEDGYKDFVMDYISNYQNCDIGFYDKRTRTFKVIANFDGQPVKIKDSQYYYSYARAGCADSNWYSELFYIENYILHKIGIIEGKGCEDEEENGVFIYMTGNKGKTLIKSIPRKAGSYKDKWDFIETYWNKNYKLFE